MAGQPLIKTKSADHRDYTIVGIKSCFSKALIGKVGLNQMPFILFLQFPSHCQAILIFFYLLKYYSSPIVDGIHVKCLFEVQLFSKACPSAQHTLFCILFMNHRKMVVLWVRKITFGDVYVTTAKTLNSTYHKTQTSN